MRIIQIPLINQNDYLTIHNFSKTIQSYRLRIMKIKQITDMVELPGRDRWERWNTQQDGSNRRRKVAREEKGRIPHEALLKPPLESIFNPTPTLKNQKERWTSYTLPKPTHNFLEDQITISAFSLFRMGSTRFKRILLQTPLMKQLPTFDPHIKIKIIEDQ